MTVATQIEILDLRHFSARQLRPLLEREARDWEVKLRWNYQQSTELLLEYLDSQALPGLVALEHGRICGFTFYVHEGHKAVIGDAYASVEKETDSFYVVEILLQNLLQTLKYLPEIERIESQLLLYGAGELNPLFTSAEFSIFPRQFLELNLTAASHPASQAVLLPNDYELSSWSADNYYRAAELIQHAYAGHMDAQINDQYRSLHGSLRFLHNIVRFPGCGVFIAEASWVLRNQKTGALAGMVLCSNVGNGVIHVTQLCVAPEFRGHGLAEYLMRHCLHKLREIGTDAVTLTVTEANHKAMQLYHRLGFAPIHQFEAMVFEAQR